VITSQCWNEPVAENAKQYDISKKAVEEALEFYSAHKNAVDTLISENDALTGTHD